MARGMAVSEKPGVQPPGQRPFPIWGYVALNAVVWVFSLLMLGAVWWQIRDITGMVFFALILPIGFGAVSVFDALYDRMSRRPAGSAQESQAPSLDAG